MTDDELVLHVVAAVDDAQVANAAPTQAHLSLLRAISATRDEARRHELARQARSHLQQLTEVGLGVLRVVLALA